MQDVIDKLAETIRDAAARKAPLRIRGGGTKDFYGGELQGEVLETRPYSGIVDYEPTELVLTARAGTPLAEIEALLREHGQMLAFEPPRFSTASTLGGCIAAGLSGPRRPYGGSARDHVLGVRILDGNGTDLKFGGQVMKNVAGYDVSRLMVGALGTLGVLLEISLKVLPAPASVLTLRQERPQAAAIDLMNAWAGKPYPISGTCHTAEALYVRLSGAQSAVRAACTRLGGDEVAEGETFWRGIRDHTHAFFESGEALWRVSLKSTCARVAPGSAELVEWGGALRWISGSVDPATLRETAARANGHATLFRGGDKSVGVFQPLTAPLMKLHTRLKATFDPHGILNRGRLYPGF
jgi:glycolate oxidase FAD binding subunit